MLTQKHIQFICLALALATGIAGAYAVPFAGASSAEAANSAACVYSAQTCPVLVLGSGPLCRTSPSLFFHALNAGFGKAPAETDWQGHILHAGTDRGSFGYPANHCTLLALSCMLTV